MQISAFLGQPYYVAHNLAINSLSKFGVSDYGLDYVRADFSYLFYLTKQTIHVARRQKIVDKLPFPPSRLLYLVTRSYDKNSFFLGGCLGARCIRDTLAKNGLDMNKFEAILDFGCGCGRILRHWNYLRGPEIYGSDYNKKLVNWCQKNLPFARVSRNELKGKLEYSDGKFDLVYAISVFTHLSESLQDFWLEELTRILKPGGYLLISLRGTQLKFVGRLALVKQKFDLGERVVLESEVSGTNYCNAYHPFEFVKKWVQPKLKLVDYVPGGAKDANQDFCLLMKP